MGGPPGAGEMGRRVGGLLEVPQVLLPLAGIGGLDPGSSVGPGTQAAGVLTWDLVGVGAGDCQPGVQGRKGAAGPAGVGAAARGVPGVGGPGQAVEGHLRNRKSAHVRGGGVGGARTVGAQEAGPSLTLRWGSLLSRRPRGLLGGLAAQGQGPWGRSLRQRSGAGEVKNSHRPARA